MIGGIISTYEQAKELVIPKESVPVGQNCILKQSKATELDQDRPFFACVIGSFSLAGRLMDVSQAMIYCYEEPDMVHLVLEKVTEFIIEYCLAYKAAGANGVILAEPLAGLLSPSLAAEFSADYIKQIVAAVPDEKLYRHLPQLRRPPSKLLIPSLQTALRRTILGIRSK